MSEAQTWLSCACIPDPDTREQPSHPALLQRFPAFSSQCPFSWWPRKHFSFKFHSWRFYYVHPIPRQCLSFHHSLSFSCHPGSCSTVMNFFSFSHLLIRWDFASFSAHFAHLECISYLKPHSTRKDIVKYPPLPHWSLSFMLPSLNFLWTLDLEGFFFSPLNPNKRHWSPTLSHALTKKRIQRATRTSFPENRLNSKCKARKSSYRNLTPRVWSNVGWCDLVANFIPSSESFSNF